MALKPPDGATLPTSSRVDVLFEAPINVQYPEYGALGDDAANDATAINNAIAAVGADGGQVLLPPGIYRHSIPISADAKKVEIIGHRAKLKATAAMAQSILLNKITDAPGFGVRGVVIDMASLALIGLVVKNCWATHNDVRIENPGTGTGVKVHTDDVAFGCYYNRVDGQVRGSDGAGSIGVLIQGSAPTNAANSNVVGRMHVTDMATGVKIGSDCDANYLQGTDCTSCATGYDFTSGVTQGFALWEESNTTNGFIVRAGAKAILDVLYSDSSNTAATTGLLLVRKNGIDAWTSNTADIDQTVNVPGNWGLRYRIDPDSGEWRWIEDGVRTAFIISHSGYYEMSEISEPGAPAANGARVFVRDNAGKSQLCIRFASGATQVIATEP